MDIKPVLVYLDLVPKVIYELAIARLAFMIES